MSTRIQLDKKNFMPTIFAWVQLINQRVKKKKNLINEIKQNTIADYLIINMSNL